MVWSFSDQTKCGRGFIKGHSVTWPLTWLANPNVAGVKILFHWKTGYISLCMQFYHYCFASCITCIVVSILKSYCKYVAYQNIVEVTYIPVIKLNHSNIMSNLHCTYITQGYKSHGLISSVNSQTDMHVKNHSHYSLVVCNDCMTPKV